MKKENKFATRLLPMLREADSYLETLSDADFHSAVNAMEHASGITPDEAFDGLLTFLKPKVQVVDLRTDTVLQGLLTPQTLTHRAKFKKVASA